MVKPGQRIVDAAANLVTATDAGVVVKLLWRLESSEEVLHRYQTLKMRDGLVFEIQDYREERSARRGLR